MSYQVLATKWRPKNFAEMVGQAHVLKALTNALDNDRVHHAFLYTGTRGVGKTTVARILAKALNCEQGVSSKPCGSCSACIEIDEGHFVDLIEVDAASRTKVEDTRELLDNVQYAPTRGRYKIYLIDEVHMLSTHSFNALLKTLEEPPSHVKFLLATTDPQKLPVTILSRCLQFNLKRLPIDQISAQIEKILNSEKIKFDQSAIKAIARAADGSMRDALSLLDQAISFGNETLYTNDVIDMLGTIEQTTLYDLVKAIAASDANLVMQVLSVSAELGPNYSKLLDDLISMLHRIALAQLVPNAVDDWYEDKDKLLELAQLIDEEQVQLYYQIALHGKKDLPYAPDAKDGFEMLLLRMLAFQPKKVIAKASNQVNSDNAKTKNSHAAVQAKTSGGEQRAPVKPTEIKSDAKQVGSSQVSAEQMNPEQVNPEQANPKKVSPQKIIKETASISNSASANLGANEWRQMVQQLDTVATAKQLAQNSILIEKTNTVVSLLLNVTVRQLSTDKAIARLEKSIQKLLGQPIKLIIKVGDTKGASPAEIKQQEELKRQQQAVEAVQQDSVVQEMQSVLGATLMPEYVQSNPIEKNTDT